MAKTDIKNISKEKLSALLYDWHNLNVLRNQNHDITYFIDQVKQYNSKNILVVGAGTGRVSIPLSEISNVTSMDIDKGRLDRLLRKKPGMKVINMDICVFSSSDKFDLIILPYNTFLNIETEKIISCMLSVSKVLSEEGMCLLDVSTSFNFKDKSDWKEFTTAPSTELGLEVTEFQKIERGPEQLIIYKNYVDSQGRKLLLTEEKYHYYDKEYLRNSIESGLLKIKKIDIGYGDEYTKHRLIYKCQK